MLTLLSPAKKLNMDPVEISVPVTEPRLRDDTKELAIVAKKQTANDLKRLMHISDDLAAMNYERFQAFNLESRSNSAKPAGLAFDGDVIGDWKRIACRKRRWLTRRITCALFRAFMASCVQWMRFNPIDLRWARRWRTGVENPLRILGIAHCRTA